MKLKEKIDHLTGEAKKLFASIYQTDFFIFETDDQYIKNQKPEFALQEILFLRDLVRKKEVVFNPKRKKRGEPKKEVKIEEKSDPFCHPLTETPVDYFGRLENEHAITALNLAQASPYHSLVIFKKHNPFLLELVDFTSAIELAEKWFHKVTEKLTEPFRFLIWNFHYRAGASIEHPHFQLFALPKLPLAIQKLSAKINFYQGNYWQTLQLIAQNLEIDFSDQELVFFFDLTPVKDAGAIFTFDLANKESLRKFWQILTSLQKVGIESFNLIYFYDPPMKNFGFFVDRGNLEKVNSDIGSLELFLYPIITTDPVELSQWLRQKLTEG